MAAPLVSVVIPNWNGARYLRACLDSLRAQTYQPREILVVDGASADDSRTLVAAEYLKTLQREGRYQRDVY